MSVVNAINLPTQSKILCGMAPLSTKERSLVDDFEPVLSSLGKNRNETETFCRKYNFDEETLAEAVQNLFQDCEAGFAAESNDWTVQKKKENKPKEKDFADAPSKRGRRKRGGRKNRERRRDGEDAAAARTDGTDRNDGDRPSRGGRTGRGRGRSRPARDQQSRRPPASQMQSAPQQMEPASQMSAQSWGQTTPSWGKSSDASQSLWSPPEQTSSQTTGSPPRNTHEIPSQTTQPSQQLQAASQIQNVIGGPMKSEQRAMHSRQLAVEPRFPSPTDQQAVSPSRQRWASGPKSGAGKGGRSWAGKVSKPAVGTRLEEGQVVKSNAEFSQEMNFPELSQQLPSKPPMRHSFSPTDQRRSQQPQQPFRGQQQQSRRQQPQQQSAADSPSRADMGRFRSAESSERKETSPAPERKPTKPPLRHSDRPSATELPAHVLQPPMAVQFYSSRQKAELQPGAELLAELQSGSVPKPPAPEQRPQAAAATSSTVIQQQPKPQQVQGGSSASPAKISSSGNLDMKLKQLELSHRPVGPPEPLELSRRPVGPPEPLELSRRPVGPPEPLELSRRPVGPPEAVSTASENILMNSQARNIQNAQAPIGAHSGSVWRPVNKGRFGQPVGGQASDRFGQPNRFGTPAGGGGRFPQTAASNSSVQSSQHPQQHMQFDDFNRRAAPIQFGNFPSSNESLTSGQRQVVAARSSSLSSSGAVAGQQATAPKQSQQSVGQPHGGSPGGKHPQQPVGQQLQPSAPSFGQYQPPHNAYTSRLPQTAAGSDFYQMYNGKSAATATASVGGGVGVSSQQQMGQSAAAASTATPTTAVASTAAAIGGSQKAVQPEQKSQSAQTPSALQPSTQQQQFSTTKSTVSSLNITAAARTASIPAARTASIPAARTASIPAARTASIPAARTASIPAVRTASIPAARTASAARIASNVANFPISQQAQQQQVQQQRAAFVGGGMYQQPASSQQQHQYMYGGYGTQQQQPTAAASYFPPQSAAYAQQGSGGYGRNFQAMGAAGGYGGSTSTFGGAALSSSGVRGSPVHSGQTALSASMAGDAALRGMMGTGGLYRAPQQHSRADRVQTGAAMHGGAMAAWSFSQGQGMSDKDAVKVHQQQAQAVHQHGGGRLGQQPSSSPVGAQDPFQQPQALGVQHGVSQVGHAGFPDQSAYVSSHFPAQQPFGSSAFTVPTYQQQHPSAHQQYGAANWNS